jgi:hypothetical protein
LRTAAIAIDDGLPDLRSTVVLHESLQTETDGVGPSGCYSLAHEGIDVGKQAVLDTRNYLCHAFSIARRNTRHPSRPGGVPPTAASVGSLSCHISHNGRETAAARACDDHDWLWGLRDSRCIWRYRTHPYPHRREARRARIHRGLLLGRGLLGVGPVPEPARADHARAETLYPRSQTPVGRNKKNRLGGSLSHSSESVVAGSPSVNYLYAMDDTFLDTGASLAFQSFAAGSAAALRTWRAEALEDERRAADRPSDPSANFSGHWWSTPALAGLTASTRSVAGLGPVGLVLVEDGMGWTSGTVERLLADPEVRVYEIDGSEAWTKLASGYHWT